MIAKLKKFHDRSGVTLVELLVVILIVTILAVTMLPMFKKYVVKAQYAAEPLPLVGHVRTQIGLFQYEFNNLPGVVGQVQTYRASAATASNTVKDWEQVQFALRAVSSATAPARNTLGDGQEFFLTQMQLKSDEFVGKKMKPNHFQYCNIGTTGGSYAYAVGIFGDDQGLPQGTGYAVFEAFVKGASADGVKVVGTWEEYTGLEVTQVNFALTSGSDPKYSCKIPGNILSQTTVAGVNGLVTSMKSDGWRF